MVAASFCGSAAVREAGAGVLSVATEMGQRLCSKGGPDSVPGQLADLNQPSGPSPAATEQPSVASLGVAAPPPRDGSTSTPPAPRTSILGDNPPANSITASPSAHTATQHQLLPTVPLEQPAASFAGIRRGQRWRPSQGSRELPAPLSRHQQTTPSDTLCPPLGRPAGGYRRGHGFVGRLN
jgi:hypothetical protein